MGKLKLTSPGILLIFAVLSAGGIFLLDLFYLKPCVEAQRTDALRQEAVQVEHEVRLALQGEQNSLARLSLAARENPHVTDVLSSPGRPDEFDAFADRTLGRSNVDLAWVADSDGRIVHLWYSASAGARAGGLEALGPATRETIKGLLALSPRPALGLTRAAEKILLFARQDVVDPQAGEAPLASVWLGRYLDGLALQDVCSAGRRDVTFVPADSLPPSAVPGMAESQAVWPTGEDGLVVAWLVKGAAGGTLGYFRVELPVVHIQLQAATARRTALIMLSLSVGFAALVILGTHILITGPILRLMKRLNQWESGDDSVKSLTHDLHGEPLVLARRLESAFDKLAHMSKTDQLTGLANRRHFEEVLGCFYHQARRYNRPLSMMMIDLDFFKAVNDTGGHAVGDELLKAVAAAIEKACRKADLPARLGGDEFAVLLPETGSADAQAVAERIAQAVSGQPMKIRSSEFNPTLSVGLADLNAGEIDSPDAMLALADRALYTAKELGRNRIVQAHDVNGLSLGKGRKETERVNVLCRKLAGLDTEFKSLFLRAIEEVVELLAQRNPYMGEHACRVKHYSALLAREMGLPHRVIERLQIAAALHDIGMIAMPDAVLLAPGDLNEEQVQVMRRHPLLSVRIMEGMEFLEQEIPAVRYHHERFDGKGYPEGLSGSTIPLTARILAVADAFEAMTSARSFRPAKTRLEAIAEMKLGSGTQFDPAVVDAFINVVVRLGDKLMDASVDIDSIAEAANEAELAPAS